MKTVITLATVALFATSCTSYFYVVRHAERQDNSANSPLSAAGLARAQVLKDTLKSISISRIFASTFLRTQQTAQPTATDKNLQLTIYDPDTTAGLITRLKKIKGSRVLVTGHSDNVPVIVAGLSNQTVPAIGSNDFDNFYIIKIRYFFGARRWLWQQTYGSPSP
ncbi:MAG: phosphoglycerate mutase family protein [Ferruginibacter sp.]